MLCAGIFFNKMVVTAAAESSAAAVLQLFESKLTNIPKTYDRNIKNIFYRCLIISVIYSL